VSSAKNRAHIAGVEGSKTMATLEEVLSKYRSHPDFFGICPAAGTVLDGKHCSWQEVGAGGLPVMGRLHARSGATTASWFRQDKPFLERLLTAQKSYASAQVVAQLIALFPEVETYWRTGTVGPHLRVL
jgi:hypothetical protein